MFLEDPSILLGYIFTFLLNVSSLTFTGYVYIFVQIEWSVVPLTLVVVCQRDEI